MACDTYVICFVLYLPKNGITVNNDGLLIARQHKHKNLIKPIQELSFYVWAEDEILLNEGNDLNCEGGGVTSLRSTANDSLCVHLFYISTNAKTLFKFKFI